MTDDPTAADDSEAGLDLSAMLGGLGGAGMGGLLQQAQQMMASLNQAAEAEVEGRSGGGAVKIRTTGRFEFVGVTIDPSVVDPAEVDLLEDLVLAALRDAASKVASLSPGLAAMPDLGSLFGGS